MVHTTIPNKHKCCKLHYCLGFAALVFIVLKLLYTSRAQLESIVFPYESYKEFKSVAAFELSLNESKKQIDLTCDTVIGQGSVNISSQTVRSAQNCNGPFIIQKKMGRLGNNICEYLSLQIFQISFKAVVSMDSELFGIISSIFENVGSSEQNSECMSKIYEISHAKLYAMLSEERNSPGSHPLDYLSRSTFKIISYPCLVSELMIHRKSMVGKLVFQERIVALADRRLENLLKKHNLSREGKVLISVHVRRTDYDKYMNEKYNRSVITHIYYKQAFHYMRLRFQNILFILASDDPAWCEKFLSDKDVLILESDPKVEPIVDLALMSRCDHHIFGLGTFGFVGAFVGSGIIVHPYVLNGKPTAMEKSLLCTPSPDLVAIPDEALKLP